MPTDESASTVGSELIVDGGMSTLRADAER
jgi:hypothetical protein